MPGPNEQDHAAVDPLPIGAPLSYRQIPLTCAPSPRRPPTHRTAPLLVPPPTLAGFVPYSAQKALPAQQNPARHEETTGSTSDPCGRTKTQ